MLLAFQQMSAVIYEQLLHLKKAPHGSAVDGGEPLSVKGVGVSAHPDYSSDKRQGPCFDRLHQRCDSSFLNREEESRGGASAPTGFKTSGHSRCCLPGALRWGLPRHSA